MRVQDLRQAERTASLIVGEPVAIEVKPLPGLDGKAEWPDSGRRVYLSADMVQARPEAIMYTLLHELGHHVLGHVAGPADRAAGNVAPAKSSGEYTKAHEVAHWRKEQRVNDWVIEKAQEWLTGEQQKTAVRLAQVDRVRAAAFEYIAGAAMAIDDLTERLDKIEGKGQWQRQVKSAYVW